jgi:perosamine synthetase
VKESVNFHQNKKEVKYNIPLFKIYWDEEDINQTNKVMRSGVYWTAGSETTIFEKMLAEYIGRRYCLVFNSGTSALHAVLTAHNIGPGDEVIVPSFTFIATANAVIFVGAKPVFGDIEENTYGLDPDDVRRKITPRTKAIIPVHYGGGACRVKELRDIADTSKILLIEDAAEALGAMVGVKKVGTFGQSAVLSFCQNKIITTGEGGAIVTDSKDVYEKAKLFRSHGRQETGNYFATSEYMDYITLGYNFRLTSILAALGIAQIQKIEKIIEMRRQNAEYMEKLLSKIDQIFIPELPYDYFHVFQMFNVRIKGKQETRDKLMAYLSDKGIASRVNFYPVHLTKFYRDKYGNKEGELPVTEMISKQVLTLPLYPTLTKEEIDYIVSQISAFFSGQ